MDRCFWGSAWVWLRFCLQQRHWWILPGSLPEKTGSVPCWRHVFPATVSLIINVCWSVLSPLIWKTFRHLETGNMRDWWIITRIRCCFALPWLCWRQCSSSLYYGEARRKSVWRFLFMQPVPWQCFWCFCRWEGLRLMPLQILPTVTLISWWCCYCWWLPGCGIISGQEAGSVFSHWLLQRFWWWGLIWQDMSRAFLKNTGSTRWSWQSPAVWCYSASSAWDLWKISPRAVLKWERWQQGFWQQRFWWMWYLKAGSPM